MAALCRPVDIAALVFFRIAFGLFLLVEVLRYSAYGWIHRFYVAPAFHFKYQGFEWLHTPSAPWVYALFAVVGLSAVCVTLGFYYRVAAPLLCVTFTCLFLQDETRYLNHFYLIILLSFLMCWIPAHRSFSLDALRRPAIRSGVVPFWTLALIRFQIGIVYFYAGIAKLTPDWIAGEPMRTWLARRAERPLIGWLAGQESAVMFFSYGGLFFDLLVVPALLWKKTRPAAFAVALGFHLTNAFVFGIGIFPWFMIVATLLFFPSDWPRRLVQPGGKAQAVEGPGVPMRAGAVIVLVLYVTLQILIPLRHHLYPGNVSWTEEGYRFSWRMKLRDKGGRAVFHVRDRATGRTSIVGPESYMTGWQATRMAVQPDMVLQFSHFLADRQRAQGHDDIEIFARVSAALNGREFRPLIDPRVDLLTRHRTLDPADWILPLGD